MLDNKQKTKKLAAVLTLIGLNFHNSCYADNNSYSRERTTGSFYSDEAQSTRRRAMQAMQDSNRELRLRELLRASNSNVDDLDIHVQIAETCEQLCRSGPKNSEMEMYRLALKHWLIVMRNEVGEEANMNFRGFTILPGVFDDEDRSRKARNRIKELAGCLPRPWESRDAFIKRRCNNVEMLTSAKLLKSGEVNQD